MYNSLEFWKFLLEESVKSRMYVLHMSGFYVSPAFNEKVGPISLSRNGEKCFYLPKDFAEHNGHAPVWVNGTAPESSSVPGMRVEDYLTRIIRDVLTNLEDQYWKEVIVKIR